MSKSNRGPMCSSWCGPNWIDDGSMCRSKSLVSGPAVINEPPQNIRPDGLLMRDYRQHLPMNCGGIAAVFAVFGMNEEVPKYIVNNVLIKEKLSAVSIANYVSNSIPEYVNKLNKWCGLKFETKTFLTGTTIPTSNDNKTPINFLEKCSKIAIVKEGIKDILITNNARCTIISCSTAAGYYHWQVFYLPLKKNNLAIYNEADGWYPAISNVPLGTPSGLVLVYGPRLEENTSLTCVNY